MLVLTWADVTKQTSSAGNVAWGSNAMSLSALIGLFFRAAIGLVGIIFLILAIYSGFRWMTARGDKASVTEAKETLKNAIIGLIMVVLAYTITQFVTGLLISTSSVAQ